MLYHERIGMRGRSPPSTRRTSQGIYWSGAGNNTSVVEQLEAAPKYTQSAKGKTQMSTKSKENNR